MKYTKAVLLGLALWAVPFITACFFVDPATKQYVIDIHVFKTIMLLEAGLLGAILAAWYFRGIKVNYFTEGLIVGIIWFAVNCVLDIAILVPMTKMPLSVWFGQIGARYLMAPIMTAAMGYMADKK